jgi:hypothetical protein
MLEKDLVDEVLAEDMSIPLLEDKKVDLKVLIFKRRIK